MSERLIEVVPEAGLHARPAATFVETVTEYNATVTISRVDSDEAMPAESMLAVTSLGVSCGETVHLTADGAEAEAVLDALERILTSSEDELVDT